MSQYKTPNHICSDAITEANYPYHRLSLCQINHLGLSDQFQVFRLHYFDKLVLPSNDQFNHVNPALILHLPIFYFLGFFMFFLLFRIFLSKSLWEFLVFTIQAIEVMMFTCDHLWPFKQISYSWIDVDG